MAKETAPQGLTCPLCLQADEPQSMLTLELEHHRIVRGMKVSICLRCFEAAAQALGARQNEEASADLADEQTNAVPGALGDSGLASACHGFEVGVQDQPDRESPGEHRPEPAADAGGETVRPSVEPETSAGRVRRRRKAS